MIQNAGANSIEWEKLSRAIHQCIRENIKHAERKTLVAKLQCVAAAMENAKTALLAEVAVKQQIQSLVTDIEQLFLMQPNSTAPHRVHPSGS